ncbi:MAG TPA: histidine phosphatase family protein [Candidatus Hydrogenedentes bacterium]|jgi:serine/threonine-protein phosphatase PGAM5|nr:MAG: bifunctional RNase H/acid phosphatase [Candidatus Hydrogenedentes bacterium ADurb.Bin170]HNZ48690.1 histidine phosphatase family protein [Candidatus Hydrogenedentota bacterium]HOD94945.1 histidine phosphatase family protein [Candidatus Hydrogenedentota bacterium]HOM48104.1 histidine phosphatase family protein [Candidatus Hydrogenedentota bacterium]HOR51396.1 histidine phosphatase family protein [Candidatus Hydrogenedentota bacterium]
MAVRVLYLIRHGQHDLNNPSGSSLGGPLTPLGIRQAEITAKTLAMKPISSIHSSSLNRADQTAKIIAKEFPAMNVQTTDLLWECIPTLTPKLQLEMPNYNDALAAQDRRRAEIAFRRYFKVAKRSDRHDIIICHGNLIRFFITLVLKADPSSWVRMDLANCGISQVLIQPEGDMALLCHNDWSHLPKELRTSTLRPPEK